MNGFCYATMLLVAAQYGSFNPTPLDELTINVNLGQTKEATDGTGYETFDEEDEDELKTGQTPAIIPIVVGGVDNENNHLTTSQDYRTITTAEWKDLNYPMEFPRSQMGVAFFGLVLFMAGGKGEGDDPLDSVYYRTYKTRWIPFHLNLTQIKARMYNALTVVNLNINVQRQRMVVTGGLDKENKPMNSTEIFFDLLGWVGDKEWEMNYPRFGHAAVPFKSNKRLYVLGGQGETKNTEITTEYFESNLNKWVKGPDMTKSRAFHAAATLGKFMYVCGGMGLAPDRLYRNSCERGDDGGFQSMKSMKEARAHFGMLVKDDKEIWAIGGYNGAKTLDSVEKYNILAQIWVTDITKLTPPRKFFGAAGGKIAENSLIVVGGEDNEDKAVGSTQAYKISSSSEWRDLNNLMENPRSLMGVAFFDDKLCMAGGIGGKREGPGPRDEVYCRTLEGPWNLFTPGPRLKHARMFNTLTVVQLNINDDQPKMVVTGGKNKEPMKSMEIFLSEDSWTARLDWQMNIARYGHAAVAFKPNNLYVLGGYEKLDSGSAYVGQSTEYFKSPINKWIMGPNLVESRVYHAAVVLGDFMYVCGGTRRDLTILRSCERGDDDGFQNTIKPMNEARSNFGMVAMDDGKIWAIGGYNYIKGVLDSIEKYNVGLNSWVTDEARLNPPRKFFGATTNAKFGASWKQFMSTSSRIVNNTKV